MFKFVPGLAKSCNILYIFESKYLKKNTFLAHTKKIFWFDNTVQLDFTSLNAKIAITVSSKLREREYIKNTVKHRPYDKHKYVPVKISSYSNVVQVQVLTYFS